MRITLLICFVLALIEAASGQELTRRERLRKLISAARGGDSEARSTLRDLRDKLKRRSREGALSQPALQQQTSVSSEPASHSQQQFTPIQQRFEPEVATRRQRVRPQAQFAEVQQRFDSTPQAHRAISRRLEVDTRSEAHGKTRVTNQNRTPPVETIRRYSYFDDEGNYIFGYEAEDGSFKEEKRGKDCIVNGKYGYVDPEGIRREFTYVSGNQCDPNAPKDSELQQPLPLNDQFLIQTQEQQLGHKQVSRQPSQQAPRPVQQRQPAPQRAVIPQLEPHTRRQPHVVRQPQTRRQPHVVRQPQTRRQPQIVRQPHRGSRVKSEVRRPIQVQNVVEEEPIHEDPKVTLDETIQEPLREPELEDVPLTPERSPLPSHFDVQPVLVRRPESNTIFRPNTRSVNHDFNFDKEFKQIFDTFSAQSRPQSQPIESSHTSTALPPPLPKSTKAPTPKKPAPKPKFGPVFTPQFSSSKPNTGHHQLVFDAASGTFQTVPLTKGSPFKPVPSLPSPPPSPSPPPTSKKVGKSLPGLGPLPTVPLGSLSFGNSGSGDFDNFFSHF